MCSIGGWNSRLAGVLHILEEALSGSSSGPQIEADP